MANVTYYIGAGASAGKRKENGAILEGLPIVNEITKRIDYLIARISKAKFYEGDRDWRMPHFQLNTMKDWEEARQRLIANLSHLRDACHRNATIDTYAKKLVLQGRKMELEHLERLLTFYFVVEQILGNPDSRYDTFLANILGNLQQFPDNIKVISWNYDSQFEIAYYEYEKANRLKIGSKLSSENLPYDILKLNGSATFQGPDHLPAYILHRKEDMKKPGHKDFYVDADVQMENILPDLVLLYHLYVGEASQERENKTNLSFAFDYNQLSDVMLHRANQIIEKTEALVIIGYTFPFFNREMDRMVLDLLDPDTEIYIQDKNPERVKQSFLAVCPGVKEYKIHLVKDVDQFFLPPQL